MTASSSFILYGRHGAGSVAPQVLLEELGLPYRMVWMDEPDADHAAYAAINPGGTVPTLVLPDGTAIFESAAIMIHLCAAFETPLAPRPGSVAHAKFLQWMVFLSANLYGAALRIYYPQRYSAGGEAHGPGVHQQALQDYRRHMGVIEAALSPYLLGADVSAADLYLTMLAFWYPGGIDEVKGFAPKVAALGAAIAARPTAARVIASNA